MNDQPTATSLDDPLYYLKNARTLILWVRKLHDDLLTPSEQASLDQLLALTQDAQALLIRMVMRSQTVYRQSQLTHYSEISEEPGELLSQLATIGLIELEPLIELAQLPDLLNREELLAVHNQISTTPLPKSCSKARIKDALAELSLPAQSLSNWISQDTPTAALRCQALFDRLQLMFFGNLRQNWSEFVVTELGYFNYEPVDLNHSSRAFHQREEVDQYLSLDAIYEQTETHSLAERVAYASAVQPTNDWISGRHARLLYSLGQEAQRADETALALELYRQSGLPDALIRELRLMEKTTDAQAVAQRLEEPRLRRLTPLHQLSIARIESRCYKKLGIPSTLSKLRSPDSFKLSIPRPQSCVEIGTLEALGSEMKPVAYVENTLINALFGLLFWDAIYAPVPGAFFNPFQSHPADLYRSGFAAKRSEQINAAWEQFNDGRYIQTILERYEQKLSVTNAFIHWAALSPELLHLALKLIPARHLQLIFERLLSDIRTHRSGFPDLIQFDLEQGYYQLIEVKGPGDKLQDNQKLWLDYFVEHQIPCSVCWVSWSDTGE